MGYEPLRKAIAIAAIFISGRSSPMVRPARGVMATEVVANGAIDAESVQLRQRILPPPGNGEALVAVTASGVPALEVRTNRSLPRYGTQSSYVPGCDLVGTVHSVGPNVNPVLVGRQVAALTETGGWTDFALVSAAALVPALDMLDPAAVESLLIDGVAARQMLHRHVQLPASTNILVHIGSGYGIAQVLMQLAARQQIRVVLAASSDRSISLTGLDAAMVDPDADDFVSQVRSLAPGGLQAAFIHHDDAGAFPLVDDLLATGGRLVKYTTSVKQRRRANAHRPLIELSGKTRVGKMPHKEPSVIAYDIWTGYRVDGGRFRDHLREDLTYVLDLLARNAITASVDARLPLERVAEAIELAQSTATVGRVVLTPKVRSGVPAPHPLKPT